MKLSIVTTAYKSAPFLPEFHLRITNAVKKITDDYEIIFVNDGCPLDSAEVIKKIINQDKKSKLIDLSRNFGHHKAMMTAISYTKGDYVFTIDCDLEESPEDLEKFYQKIQESNDDCVNAFILKRKGGLIERKFDGLFYPIFNFFSDQKIKKNLCTASLMNRRYVDALICHREQNCFLAGIKAINGFKQSYIAIKKDVRNSNDSANNKRTYNLSRRISLLINAITSFSSTPLYYIFALGISASLLSFAFGCFLLYKKLFYSISIDGWASIMVSLWFIGGIVMMCLGIIAIYLAKMYNEIKARPYTIVKEIYTK